MLTEPQSNPRRNTNPNTMKRSINDTLEDDALLQQQQHAQMQQLLLSRYLQQQQQQQQQQQPQQYPPTSTIPPVPLGPPPPPPPPTAADGEPVRKRRKQVKRACLHCRRSHLSCADERPCPRCVRMGINCVDNDDELQPHHNHEHEPVQPKPPRAARRQSHPQPQQQPLQVGDYPAPVLQAAVQILTSGNFGTLANLIQHQLNTGALPVPPAHEMSSLLTSAISTMASSNSSTEQLQQQQPPPPPPPPPQPTFSLPMPRPFAPTPSPVATGQSSWMSPAAPTQSQSTSAAPTPASSAPTAEGGLLDEGLFNEPFSDWPTSDLFDFGDARELEQMDNIQFALMLGTGGSQQQQQQQPTPALSAGSASTVVPPSPPMASASAAAAAAGSANGEEPSRTSPTGLDAISAALELERGAIGGGVCPGGIVPPPGQSARRLTLKESAAWVLELGSDDRDQLMKAIEEYKKCVLEAYNCRRKFSRDPSETRRLYCEALMKLACERKNFILRHPRFRPLPLWDRAVEQAYKETKKLEQDIALLAWHSSNVPCMSLYECGYVETYNQAFANLFEVPLLMPDAKPGHRKRFADFIPHDQVAAHVEMIPDELMQSRNVFRGRFVTQQAHREVDCQCVVTSYQTAEDSTNRRIIWHLIPIQEQSSS